MSPFFFLQRIGRDEMPAIHLNEIGGIPTVSDAKHQNVPVVFSPLELRISWARSSLILYLSESRQTTSP
jgi:hypothetical protein